MTVKPGREIILLKESAAESWMRDMSSVVGFVALIGIGVLLHSNAMQWVGAILGFLTITARMKQLVKNNSFTIEGARKRLDELERASQ